MTTDDRQARVLRPQAESMGEACRLAVETMRAGGVVLLGTDTVYGLACAPDAAAAISAIYRLKDRPRGRRLPVIVSGEAQAQTLGLAWTEPAARLAAAFWPGAVTIVVGVRAAAVEWLADRDEVGLRAPASELALGIARELGPYLMTSANLHGHGTPTSLDEVLAGLAGQPDLAIDAGPLTASSSTLVNVNLPEPAIEREGLVPSELIRLELAGE